MYQSLLNPHKLDATAQRNEALGPTEAEWLSRLELTRSGRVLRNHLSCVEKRLDTHGRQGERGSIQDAICWRRAFCKALNDAVASKVRFGVLSNHPQFLRFVLYIWKFCLAGGVSLRHPQERLALLGNCKFVGRATHAVQRFGLYDADAVQAVVCASCYGH